MDEKTTRMLFATVALSALAVLFAVPAHAYISQGDGVTAVGSQQAIQTATALTGVHAALQSQTQTPATAPLPHGAEVVLSPPSEEQQSLGLTGDSALTRSVPAPPETVGLSGDSAATRYPGTDATPSPTTYPSAVIGADAATWDGHTLPPTVDLGEIQAPKATTTSSSSDFDWASFGAGAGMVALVAAGLGGILLATRRRHSVGLP